MRRWTAALALLVTAACGAVGDHSLPGGTITVFAAASLTDAFKAVGDSFHRGHPDVTVRFNFAGTPTLVTQVEQGARADVFASADTANIDRLTSGGLTAGPAQVFAHNQLEIVVAPGNPKRISGLADLARPGLIYIAEAPTVPAGKYSLEALAKAGVTVKAKSLETDVKSVISKIVLGEADAGIVYATDVRAAGDKVTGVPIPARYNVVATYPIVALNNAHRVTGFIEFVLASEGQSILESFGFQHA